MSRCKKEYETYPSCKVNFRRFEWVVGRKVNGKKVDTSTERRLAL